MSTATASLLDPNEGTTATGAEHRTPDAVAFANPFFTFNKEITFERREGADETFMVVPMSEQSISMSLPGVIKELSLKADDPDYIMLEVIEKALDYVCILRVGDPVPSEITSGDASWRILEKHRVTARQRLTLQLVSWLSGTEEIVTDPDRLAQLMDDPGIKKKVDEAFESVAESLGYGKDDKEKVVSLVESLAEELSYIEALREVYLDIRALGPKLTDILKSSRFDEFTRENALSVKRLVGEAVQTYAQEFLQIDAQTGEIMSVLKNAEQQVTFIRQMRDDLARRLLAWRDIEGRWKKLNYKDRKDVEDTLTETYRFLALRFLPAVNWKLVTQTLDEQSLKSESVW